MRGDARRVVGAVFVQGEAGVTYSLSRADVEEKTTAPLSLPSTMEDSKFLLVTTVFEALDNPLEKKRK